VSEHSVQTLRADARRHMKDLANAGLGRVDRTQHRDVFILNASHAGTAKVSPQAEQHDNFIRSENGGLLFRDPSPAFVAALEQALVRRSMIGSKKGLEFRWTAIDKPDLRALFAAVCHIAGS
jgi:hypothetical protein